MDKWRRNYLLQFELGDANKTLHTVALPLSIDFDVSRDTLASTNYAHIRIYNLSEKVRDSVSKFWLMDYKDLRNVWLYAGYGSQMALIFNGQISSAWTVREGTNSITTIEAFDGGAAMTQATVDSLPAFSNGTSIIQVVTEIIGTMAPFGVVPGVVGNVQGTFDVSKALSGKASDALRELVGNSSDFFVDTGRAYVLSPYEVVRGQVPVIDASKGLLNTPVREAQKLTLEMIFEPAIRMCETVEVQSATAAKRINGRYKVVSIKHRGMISDSVAGSVTTSLGLFFGSEVPGGPSALRVVN